jgi:hypothetical protein
MDASPIRLRETSNAAAPDARVIDASYKIVGQKRRGLLGKLWVGLIALFWAALVGFLAPPVFMLAHHLGVIGG